MFIYFLNRSGRGGSLLVTLNIRSAYQVHHMVTGECYRQQHNAVSIYNHGHPMDAVKRVPTYYRMLFTGYTRHPHPPRPHTTAQTNVSIHHFGILKNDGCLQSETGGTGTCSGGGNGNQVRYGHCNRCVDGGCKCNTRTRGRNQCYHTWGYNDTEAQYNFLREAPLHTSIPSCRFLSKISVVNVCRK